MEESRIKEIIANLEGISYLEWLKVEKAVNMAFETKKRKLEQKLQLDNNSGIALAIQSLFG